MQITHRVVVWQREPASQLFRALGFPVDEPQSVFYVPATDPRWPIVRRILKRDGILWSSDTEFDEDEFRAAVALEIFCNWTNGYPQPDDTDYRWFTGVYGADGTCNKCKTPLIQTGSFRLRMEPKWGRRALMSLFWCPDVLFCRVDFYKAAIEPLGIKCRPVLMHRTGQPLETVVQLVHQGSVPLKHHGKPARQCPRCGGRIYAYPVGGGFPLTPESSLLDYFRTAEYFGDGAAHPLKYVSQRLYQVLKPLRQRSLVFEPCEAAG